MQKKIKKLIRETTFLLKNLDDPSDELIISADTSTKIEDYLKLNKNEMFVAKPVEFIKNFFKDKNENEIGEKLASLGSQFGSAGSEALAIICVDLLENPKNASNYMEKFPKKGVWDEMSLKLFSLKSGTSSEVTGKGEISLFSKYRDAGKSGKIYDLILGGKNASVKYFSIDPSSGPRIASGSSKNGEKYQFFDGIENAFDKASANLFDVKTLKRDEVSKAYSIIANKFQKTPEEIARQISKILFNALTHQGNSILVGCSDTGFLTLLEDQICLVEITDGRARFTIAPGVGQIGTTSYSKSQWVPVSASFSKLENAKNNLRNKTVSEISNGLNDLSLRRDIKTVANSINPSSLKSDSKQAIQIYVDDVVKNSNATNDDLFLDILELNGNVMENLRRLLKNV